MSGIAEVLLNLGYRVSGSDVKESEAVARLRGLGATVHLRHDAANVEGADVVVASTAIAEQNPEVKRAHALGIPVIPRAEMLAELMRIKYSIAVAGAHGKTTTTSMVGDILARGDLDPTVIVGGRLKALGAHARLGGGPFLVAEADESDGSFLLLTPTVAVITNIDEEHLDYYGDLSSIRGAFVRFANRVPFYGAVVLPADDPHAARDPPGADPPGPHVRIRRGRGLPRERPHGGRVRRSIPTHRVRPGRGGRSRSPWRGRTTRGTPSRRRRRPTRSAPPSRRSAPRSGTLPGWRAASS
jgi:UDP-N-acetylmuramate--alanine ligase